MCFRLRSRSPFLQLAGPKSQASDRNAGKAPANPPSAAGSPLCRGEVWLGFQESPVDFLPLAGEGGRGPEWVWRLVTPLRAADAAGSPLCRGEVRLGFQESPVDFLPLAGEGGRRPEGVWRHGVPHPQSRQRNGPTTKVVGTRHGRRNASKGLRGTLIPSCSWPRKGIRATSDRWIPSCGGPGYHHVAVDTARGSHVRRFPCRSEAGGGT